MTDRKLGRIAPSFEQRANAPKLAKYVSKPLPLAPPSVENSVGARLQMFGNDRYGDCTFAALANYRAICAAKEGLISPTTDDDVVKSYLAFTGGKDQGAVEHDVLQQAMVGIELGGAEPWKLAAWVSVPLEDRETCRSLVAIFWSLYLGVELPLVAQHETYWDASSNMSGDYEPGSWGGHALLWADYEENGDVGLVTWGGVQKASPSWLGAYGDEAYVLLDADRASMIGVDWEMLISDLWAVR